MSRAFVKEPDGQDPGDELPPRPRSEHPCYMTLRGVEALRREHEAVQAEIARLENAEDDLARTTELKPLRHRWREIAAILREAIPIDVAKQPAADIRFGATVELIDDLGAPHRFQIVGEDETAPTQGKISWVSPLGRQLLGKGAGDVIIWQRPAGRLELEVVGFEYAD